MKTLLLLLLLTAAAYIGYQLLPKARREVPTGIRRHAIRLVCLLLGVIVLAYLAYFLPAASLTP